jgi:hypothetical protein
MIGRDYPFSSARDRDGLDYILGTRSAGCEIGIKAATGTWRGAKAGIKADSGIYRAAHAG